MTIVPVSVSSIDESDNAVKLARYAQIIEFPECALFGVRYDGDDLSACQHIWSHQERVIMARYLNEAQIEIEQVTHYPLSPKWFVDEQHRYQCRDLKTRWTKIIAAGVKAVANIALSEPVDHTTDPAIINVLNVGTLDPSEVHIYHPGTDAEITPSSIDVTGGVLTIEIPRCRMVLAALENTPSDGLDYADVGTCVTSFSFGAPGNFECEVDIKRVYNDTTDQGVLVYPHGKGCTCQPACESDEDDACVWVRDSYLGFVDARRAALSSLSCTCGQAPAYAKINYYAGVTELTTQMEDAIVRLCHSKMPHPPCGCDTVMEMWKRDREIPAVLDSERLNCDFGLSAGAWTAWKFANAMQTARASVL
jgi:hypothetical protein